MEALNKLVAAVMAQQSWSELETAMRQGYAPTLRGETRRQRLLTRVCRARGYRVFDGRRVA